MVPTDEERAHARSAAAQRQDELTKPAGSLGRLEALAIQLASVQACARPVARPAHALIFAADHPVASLGVSAYPAEVTRAMLSNLAAGGAAASVLARALDIPLRVVDVGVSGADGDAGIRVRDPVADARRGDLRSEPAMSAEVAQRAEAAGHRAVASCGDGLRVLVLGEIGIGNTTPAAALAAALLGRPAEELVGPGTGVDAAGLERKRAVVRAALARIGDGPHDASFLLAELGGPDLAALVGAMRAIVGRPAVVLVDGFTVGVAALAAVALEPSLKSQLVFAHRSAEPGHQHVLDALDAEPLLSLEMRLGEASGALTAFPILENALRLHAEMATFAEARVPDRSDP